MVLSSVEVFHHEALGVVLGFAGEEQFVIEYAIPYQTARKGLSWVAPRPRRVARLERILEHHPVEVIGDFHSHTELGELRALCTPSGEDIADMQNGKVHLILALNEARRRSAWSHRSDGRISGTLEGYRITMGAFYLLDGARYRFARGNIVCPSATGIRETED
jgi:proteasome lid subunit RPN8/RPN11